LFLQPAWLLISNPAAAAQTATAAAPAEAPSADAPKNNQPLPRRGALGLSFSGLSKSLAEKHGLGSGEGLVATTPVPGLTAAALGFQPGDVVLRLNGTPLKAATIGKLMREIPAGDELRFEIVRKDEPQVLSGKLLSHEIPCRTPVVRFRDGAYRSNRCPAGLCCSAWSARRWGYHTRRWGLRVFDRAITERPTLGFVHRAVRCSQGCQSTPLPVCSARR
jgi:hypothetical protein